MWLKKAILITLFLCLAGFVQAQPVMPDGPFYLESYDMPGWYMTSTDNGSTRPIQLIQGKTPEGLWLVDVPFAGDAASTISLTPVSQPGNYARHAGWILFTDPSAGANTYFNNDASWHPRAGLANPGDTTLVSFENNQYANNYIQHNTPSGNTPIGFGTGTGLTVPAGEEGRATFRIVLPDTSRASKPVPSDKSTEISIDVGQISWTPGEYAEKHIVFFGTDFDDVNQATINNPLGTTVYPDLDVNSIDLDRLELSTTYYWRVDEVNAPSKPATHKGVTWSFTTELKGYTLAASHITATANDPAFFDEEVQDPNSTCNGAGLDANDMHSVLRKDMWLAMLPDDGQPGDAYIQYEFDMPYKLYDMKIWNYNEEDPLNGYGAKDINILYSLDGQNWTQLGDTVTLEMAPGNNTCTANAPIDMQGIAAKYIKVVFLDGLSEGDQLYGISEVQFTTVPTYATLLTPDDEAADQALDVEMTWKAGRDAGEHQVYYSTDPNNMGGAHIADTTSFVPTDLELGQTYYWRVDEVNNAEPYPIWPSAVKSFSTDTSLIVDDFENYGNTEEDYIWSVWKDGVETSANGGSEIGKDIVAAGNNSPGLSTTRTHGGTYALPVNYDNTGAGGFSQVSAQSVDLPIGTANWTNGAPTTLVIWVCGDMNNIAGKDRLYAKIGSAKVVFNGDLSKDRWVQFNIDLSTAGINLSNVPSITIGIEKTGTTGGKGVVYLDDISLYRVAPVPSTEVLWIEAESGSIKAPFEVLTTLGGASGGQYIGKAAGSGNNGNSSPDPNATAAYTFTVAEDGVYMIDLRWQGSGNSDGFWVQIPQITDANNIKVENGSNAVLTSGWIDGNNMRPRAVSYWHWSYVVDDDNNGDPDVSFTLSAGTYTLKIANRDAGTFLDAILIVKVN